MGLSLLKPKFFGVQQKFSGEAMCRASSLGWRLSSTKGLQTLPGENLGRTYFTSMVSEVGTWSVQGCFLVLEYNFLDKN